MCGIGRLAYYLCPLHLCNSVRQKFYNPSIKPSPQFYLSNYTIVNNDFPLPKKNCQCGGTGYIGYRGFCADSNNQCLYKSEHFFQCTDKLAREDFCPEGFICSTGNLNFLLY